jgi:hypothetical protein
MEIWYEDVNWIKLAKEYTMMGFGITSIEYSDSYTAKKLASLLVNLGIHCW